MENIQEGVSQVETKKMSQKDAVSQFVNEALAAFEKPVNEPLSVLITKDIKKIVRQKLFEGLKQGTVALKSTKSDQELKKYSAGILANWLRKDDTYSKVNV